MTASKRTETGDIQEKWRETIVARPLQGNGGGGSGGRVQLHLGEVKFKCFKGSIFHFDQVNVGRADGEP